MLRINGALLAALCVWSCSSFAAVGWGSTSTNSATTSNGQTVSISVAKPAGTAAGDLLIASVAVGGSTNGGCVCTGYVDNPSGWALLDTQSGASGAPHQSKTYYKIAGGAEPASYTFTGGETTVFYSVAGRATIDRFTGADAVDPFAGAPSGTQGTGSTAAATFPNQTGEAAGSMRYSVLTSWSAANSTRTATFSAGLTERADHAALVSYVNAGFFYTSVSVATATEAVGSGLTTTRTATLSAAPAAWAARTYVINPAGPCSGGALTLTPPGPTSFPATALSGFDQTVNASTALSISDMTGTGAGWRVSATSTTFTSGADTLPVAATTITGASAAASTGNCTMPTSTVSYPIGLPAGAPAPAAVNIYNAAATTGQGPVDLTLDFALAVPATARTGAYTSTWTFTLSSGPS